MPDQTDPAPIKGDHIYPFRWFFRPETSPATPVVVQLKEDLHEYPAEQLHSILSEIDSRHWLAIRQLLFEAKLKAEAQLRSSEVIKQPQLTAYYQGWVNHADYVLANLEGYRAGDIAPAGVGHQNLSQNVR